MSYKEEKGTDEEDKKEVSIYGCLVGFLTRQMSETTSHVDGQTHRQKDAKKTLQQPLRKHLC